MATEDGTNILPGDRDRRLRLKMRDCRIRADPAAAITAHARKRYAPDAMSVALDQTVYTLDG